jgi:hypothetical protein
MTGIKIWIDVNDDGACVYRVEPRKGGSIPDALTVFALLLLHREALRQLGHQIPVVTVSGTAPALDSLHDAVKQGRGYVAQPLLGSAYPKGGDPGRHHDAALYHQRVTLLRPIIGASSDDHGNGHRVWLKTAKLPPISVFHDRSVSALAIEDGARIAALASQVAAGLAQDLRLEPCLSQQGSQWRVGPLPELPGNTSSSDLAIGQRNGPNHKTHGLTWAVKQPDLYKTMVESLHQLQEGATIYLTSYQIGDPLDERVAITRWHDALGALMKSKPSPRLKVLRLVAFQSLWKLIWLDEMARDLGQDGQIDFNVRLFPAPFVWQTSDEAAPLPTQIQIIGEHVLLGGRRTQESSSDYEFWGVHIPTMHDPQLRQVFCKQHQLLWSYAGNHPYEGLERSDMDVIDHGVVKPTRVKRFKKVMCKDWLTQQAKSVRSEDDFGRFRDKIIELIERGPSDWYEAVGGDEERGWAANTPYQRVVVVAFDGARADDGRPRQMVEIMLAFWASGARCLPHDHGGAFGYVFVLCGEAVIEKYEEGATGRLTSKGVERYSPNDPEVFVSRDTIHSTMCAGKGEPLVTLHIYCSPNPEGPPGYRVFDTNGERVGRKLDGGAWDEDVLWSNIT